MEPHALYIQLGRLSEAMPDYASIAGRSENNRQWFGRLVAVAKLMNDKYAVVEIRKNIEIIFGTNPKLPLKGFDTDYHTPWEEKIRTAASMCYAILHQLLAEAEMLAPTSAQGAFIAAGNSFDVMAVVGKVLASAKNDVLIVDPYMDEKALTDFALLAPAGIAVRLLADRKDHKATLAPAVRRWVAQYQIKRPLEARLAPERTLHDRLIILDDQTVWVLTQSLKDLAARSPASIVRSDGEAATLKVDAYRDMWEKASFI